MQTANNILAHPERLQYTTPEVKGRLLAIIGEAPILAKPFVDLDKCRAAMMIILAYVQSVSDYNNVLQHLNIEMHKQDAEVGRKKLHRLFGYDIALYTDIKGFNKEYFVDAKRELQYRTEKNTAVKTQVAVANIINNYKEILKASDAADSSRFFSF